MKMQWKYLTRCFR